MIPSLTSFEKQVSVVWFSSPLGKYRAGHHEMEGILAPAEELPRSTTVKVGTSAKEHRSNGKRKDLLIPPTTGKCKVTAV